MMNKLDLLITHEKIALRIKELADEISNDFSNKPLLLIAVLKGSFIFVADLIRELSIPVETEFMRLSSYSGKDPDDAVVHHSGPVNEIKGKHVIIVEDIIDTGETIKAAAEMIKEIGAVSVSICALLKRESENKEIIKADYIGFTIQEGFVVGYGLDYNEDYRYLKDICLLNNEEA